MNCAINKRVDKHHLSKITHNNIVLDEPTQISTTFKEELHNRFNLISEETVKISKHNSENLMKIG